MRLGAGKIPGARELYNFLRLLFFPSYRRDGLCTVHNCDFQNMPDFRRAYSSALRQQPDTDIFWRAHVTQWAGFHASQLRGDFVECGVNRAFLSASVITYVNFKELSDRKFYLFDTYCGLVEEQVASTDRAAHRNYYDDTYEFVKDTFKDYDNVIVVKGVVPDTLSTVEISQVAYLSIDMNCAQPERAALEYFWSKIVPGGLVILDDYGFSGHESQKDTADEFASKVGAKILSLPTGQGLLIK